MNIKSLPYELTNAQKELFRTLKDMESTKVMNRLQETLGREKL